MSRWLVTGAAGFIGSHIVQELLRQGEDVIGIDNFSTGNKANLAFAPSFSCVEGDINDYDLLCKLTCGIDFVLHQAALGSVPRSIADPAATEKANISGFNVAIRAAKDSKVKRFIYASSSSVYGDSPELPRKEDILGLPLSPYAASKRINEIYASAITAAYGMPTVGLRYFNVFGPRQNPNGEYAAVIPRWIQLASKKHPVTIFGDGSSSRDYCYVANVVNANLLAAKSSVTGFRLYNVGCGGCITLLQLRAAIIESLGDAYDIPPLFLPPRKGDVSASMADINKITAELGFTPQVTFQAGIEKTIKSML